MLTARISCDVCWLDVGGKIEFGSFSVLNLRWQEMKRTTCTRI